ncbi:hypothetical protein Bbelb_201140 [Branchiostoma belcheri]|nr:hypothetical protein Bbelb_201140 [Branchiostoma belcheri]
MLKKGGVPPEYLVTVYTTLIRPVLEYANVVYVDCNTKQNNTLEAVQRRAARIIYGNNIQTTPFSALQDRRETSTKTLFKQMRDVNPPFSALQDRRETSTKTLFKQMRDVNPPSLPSRTDGKLQRKLF